jgi:hypothetical protein
MIRSVAASCASKPPPRRIPAEQGFPPIAYLEVTDSSPDVSAAEDDGCSITPARGNDSHGRGFLAFGLLLLIGLATHGHRTGRKRSDRFNE